MTQRTEKRVERVDAVPARDDDLLSLPFDHYQRYDLTRKLVAQLGIREPDVPLSILDVGGHSSALKQFLPHDEVILTDIVPPGTFTTLPFKHDGYFQAAGGHLPFRDQSFDVVTAHDTLEHVPQESREAFLADVLRVAKRFVIINGPVHRTETATAERLMSAYLQQALGEQSHFLEDHLTLGLPSAEGIEETLGKWKSSFICIPNGNLALWLTMNALKNYLRALPDSSRLCDSLERTYNELVSPRDFGGLCYRNAYVVAKSREDEGLLQGVDRELHRTLDQAASEPGLDDLKPFVSALGDHATEVRHLFESLNSTIVSLEKLIAEKDTKLTAAEDRSAGLKAWLDAANEQLARGRSILAEKDAELAHLANVEVSLHEANVRASSAIHELNSIRASVGYRLLERIRRPIRWLAPEGTSQRYVFVAVSRALNLFLNRGLAGLVRRAPQVWDWLPRLKYVGGSQDQVSLDDQYQAWIRTHSLTATQARLMRRRAKRLRYRPLISILMPVYDPEPSWLRDAIESVLTQSYDNWELCIADDCSTRAGVREELQKSSAKDGRIRVTYLAKNGGIAEASNAAFGLASGEFIGLLDHDDELKPEALYEVVSLLGMHPDLDYIYTDEDKKAEDGRLVEPFFKPDWSPDLLMCVNYVTHFSVLRRSLVQDETVFRSGYDGSQDYDLVLRMTERTKRIAHIARPLYTWRKVPGSAAANVNAKTFAYRAGKKALKDALCRRGLEGDVLDSPLQGRYRVRYVINGEPKVTIVIPTRDRIDMLSRCVESIRKKSSYRNYEILVVDNDSQERETLEYLNSFGGRVIRHAGVFNFSAIVNGAAREADGEYILSLNNDTEVISPGWIEAMLEHAQLPQVGAVGARLLYPDGRVQHEGIVVGLGGGSAGNVDHGGYFGLGQTIRNCSAVTGACMMFRSEVFREMDGFDERLGVAFNDVDFCLRARDKGYRIVYTPYAELYHHESATRGRLHPDADERLFRSRWGNPGELQDPYYNPNLDPSRPFTLRI